MPWVLDQAVIAALRSSGRAALAGVGTLILERMPGFTGRTPEGTPVEVRSANSLVLSTKQPPASGFSCVSPLDGQTIAWGDMGLFTAFVAPALAGVNPQTGAPMTISARRKVIFTPSAALRAALDGMPLPPQATLPSRSLEQVEPEWLLSGGSSRVTRATKDGDERIITIDRASWFSNGRELRGPYVAWAPVRLASVLSAVDQVCGEVGPAWLSPADAGRLVLRWGLSAEESAEILAALPV